MVYNFNNKMLNGNIDLIMSEWKILEILIKMNGQPIRAEKIMKMLLEKYPDREYVSVNGIQVCICKINKKTNYLIKCKTGCGYYIEDIKIE